MQASLSFSSGEDGILHLPEEPQAGTAAFLRKPARRGVGDQEVVKEEK